MRRRWWSVAAAEPAGAPIPGFTSSRRSRPGSARVTVPAGGRFHHTDGSAPGRAVFACPVRGRSGLPAVTPTSDRIAGNRPPAGAGGDTGRRSCRDRSCRHGSRVRGSHGELFVVLPASAPGAGATGFDYVKRPSRGLRTRPCWRFCSRQPARHCAPAARGGPPTGGGGSKGLRPADALRHRLPASRRAGPDSTCTPTLRPAADPNLRMAAARCEET